MQIECRDPKPAEKPTERGPGASTPRDSSGQDVHEFERVGLVLEYFLRAGGFTNLETWSMRGLPRPADDKYADRMAQSDPIYAVWGEKAQ